MDIGILIKLNYRLKGHTHINSQQRQQQDDQQEIKRTVNTVLSSTTATTTTIRTTEWHQISNLVLILSLRPLFVMHSGYECWRMILIENNFDDSNDEKETDKLPNTQCPISMFHTKSILLSTWFNSIQFDMAQY